MQDKIWNIKETNSAQSEKLAKELSITPVLAQILIQRGVETKEAGEIFLNPKLKSLPDPNKIPGMEKAIPRILQAIQRKEKIAIYGDYDVDGMTSTSLLKLFFRELDIEVTTHIPDRMKEGYGLQPQILEKLKEDGIQLVITADCGSKSFESIETAKKKNWARLYCDRPP